MCTKMQLRQASGNGGIARECEGEKFEIDIVEYDQVHIFSGWLQAYNFV